MGCASSSSTNDTVVPASAARRDHRSLPASGTSSAALPADTAAASVSPTSSAEQQQQQPQQERQSCAAVMNAQVARAGSGTTSTDPRQELLAAIVFVNNSKPESWTMENPVEEWQSVNCERNGCKVFLDGCKLDAIIWARLPPSLTELALHNNQLTGTVDWAQLPRSLIELRLNNNRFTGIVDWAQLPRSLTALYLSNNQFTGTVDWAQLPRELVKLCLHDNRFTGNIDCALLPRGLTRIGVQGTMFTGIANFADQPPCLEVAWNDNLPLVHVANSEQQTGLGPRTEAAAFSAATVQTGTGTTTNASDPGNIIHALPAGGTNSIADSSIGGYSASEEAGAAQVAEQQSEFGQCELSPQYPNINLSKQTDGENVENVSE